MTVPAQAFTRAYRTVWMLDGAYSSLQGDADGECQDRIHAPSSVRCGDLTPTPYSLGFACFSKPLHLASKPPLKFDHTDIA